MLILSNNYLFLFLLVSFVYLIAFEKFKIYFKITCFYILKILGVVSIYLEIFFNLKIQNTTINFDYDVLFHVFENFFFCYPLYLLANILFFLIRLLLNNNVMGLDFYFFEYFFDIFFSIFIFYNNIYNYAYSYNFIILHNYLIFFNPYSFDFIL